MDSILAQRLRNLTTQNTTLREAEGEYLLKDAGKKTMEAEIFLTVITGTVAEREAKTYTTEEYKTYMRELSELHARYMFERRRFDILDKAFIAELNTYKIDNSLINRKNPNE